MKQALVLPLLLLLASCGESYIPPAALPPTVVSQRDVGRRVYRTYCACCHTASRTEVAPRAPHILGASRDLIGSKVLDGGYPVGYRPKRSTNKMPTFPWLKKDIDALDNYLNFKELR